MTSKKKQKQWKPEKKPSRALRDSLFEKYDKKAAGQDANWREQQEWKK